MVRLACAAQPAYATRFQPSPIDAPRPGDLPNYTVDTLAALSAQYPEATLFNLVGYDSFLTLPQWHQPGRLLSLAEWIVVSRPGYTLDLSPYTEEQRAGIHPLDTVWEEVSATLLRDRLHAGEPCDDLLPASVAAYIATHGLYGQSPSSPTLPC